MSIHCFRSVSPCGTAKVPLPPIGLERKADLTILTPPHEVRFATAAAQVVYLKPAHADPVGMLLPA